MPSERDCPDCGEAMKRMKLQGSDAVGTINVISAEPKEGFLGSFRSDEILTPVPYVCPECRRTVFYAED